jgi:phosphoribosylformylglycinamidine cyclo-ligase
VDIEAGDRAVELFKASAKRASRPEVRGGLGGFAGLFALRGGYREPVLAASSDGVGTKLAIAQAMDIHHTVGLDLVAMVVDDLVVCGAEPLFLQDYIAVGRTVPERVSAIVSGIADGCVIAGCALLGGETAEHPGLMEPDHYDISATGVGVVEADDILGPDRVRPGDVIIAMGSSGLHSNGYSLARKVLLEIDRMSLSGHVEEFGRTLGEELLEPTRIYAKDCLALAAETKVSTFCHVTGGGLAGNLERVIPNGLVAELDRGSWTPAPVFGLIAQRGRVEREEMEKTFNMGVGMVAVVAPEDTDRALAILTARHAGGTTPAVLAELGEPGTGHGRDRQRRQSSSSTNESSLSGSLGAGPANSCRSRSKSVCGELYFSSRATFVCFALARPRPMGEPPRAITERPETRRLRI